MPEDIGTNKHLKVAGKTARGRLVTAEMAADSPRGNERRMTAFQSSILIDIHGDDLEVARVSEAPNVLVENVMHLMRGSSKAVSIINFVSDGGDSLSVMVQSDHMEYNTTHSRSYANSSAPLSG